MQLGSFEAGVHSLRVNERLNSKKRERKDFLMCVSTLVSYLLECVLPNTLFTINVKKIEPLLLKATTSKQEHTAVVNILLESLELTLFRPSLLRIHFHKST